jgi:predicted small lipoprotein YifL
MKLKETALMRSKLILTGLVGFILLYGLTACGKRGDPYRPHEIQTKNQTQTPVS